MRSKRTRSTRYTEASEPKSAANWDGEDWQDYVSEEVTTQLHKYQLPHLEILDEKMVDLAKQWHFQYVMAWLFNVCESYTTTTYNADQYGGNSVKCLWKNIRFDEGIFLTDVFSKIGGKDSSYYNDEMDVDADSQNLYDKIRLQLLHQLAGNKSGQLRDWNVIVNHHCKTLAHLRIWLQTPPFWSLILLANSRSFIAS